MISDHVTEPAGVPAHTDPAPRRGFFARASEYVASGLRYWEPRRLVFDGVLLVVVAGHFVLAWPGSRDRLTLDVVLGLFVLAVLANVAYCAAYLADLFLQFSRLEAAWKWGRPILLAVGTAFAATIAHFLARAIFAT
jgi:hypothetical protein